MDVQKSWRTQLAAAAGTTPRDEHPVTDAGHLNQQLDLVVATDQSVKHRPP
jgi:hypothetical protein